MTMPPVFQNDNPKVVMAHVSNQAFYMLKVMGNIERPQAQRANTRLVLYGNEYITEQIPSRDYTTDVSTLVNTIPLITNYDPTEWTYGPTAHVLGYSEWGAIVKRRGLLLTRRTLEFFTIFATTHGLPHIGHGAKLSAVSASLEAIGTHRITPPIDSPPLWAIDTRAIDPATDLREGLPKFAIRITGD